MKKNLLSILILALLIVNIVLSVITMFSVTSTNKKTAAVVSQVATVLNLELPAGDGGEEVATGVSMADTAIYDIEDEMTILLAKGADGNAHYALVKATLSMDSKNEGYTTYGADIKSRESLIKGEISDVLSQYTADEVQARSSEIQQKILERLQTMFASDFIYKITFSEFIVQ